MILEGTKPALAQRALHVACDIGERLLHETQAPDRYDLNTERYPTRRMNGTVGYALCFLALATVTGDERYQAAMHRELAKAARAGGNERGLFSGFAGLAAVAHLAERLEPRYRNLVDRCMTALDEAPRDEERDLLFGSAGSHIARTFVGAAADSRDSAELFEALLKRNERLCLGMAHGIPGMMSALVMTNGDISSRVNQVVRLVARDLIASARPRGAALVWQRFSDDPSGEETRSVWCYGAPGIAIALLQIGQTLEDVELVTFAVDVLLRLERLPHEELLLAQFGLCHGAMGNAMVYYCASLRTDDARFTAIAERYIQETISAFERIGPRTLTRGRDGEFYDALGHLNGISGIALGLLTGTGLYPPDWLALHAMFV